jgi:TrmH family RNA methyltransferase
MGSVDEVVTSRSNARVKQLRAAFAGQARLSGGLIAIEGEHLIEEALRSGMVVKTVFISERRVVPGYVPRGVEVVRLAPNVLQSCVETQTPQGIAALLVPPLPNFKRMLLGQPLIVIAAGLQDPGNLGTLIRSAEAFGATGVLTTPGTVSAWNGKSVRASAGSVFRMPLAQTGDETWALLEQNEIAILAAVKDDAVPLQEAGLIRFCAIMIGNEGAGLAPDLLARANQRITIPMPGAVESLNAAIAGSLILYEAARQRAATPAGVNHP